MNNLPSDEIPVLTDIVEPNVGSASAFINDTSRFLGELEAHLTAVVDEQAHERLVMHFFGQAAAPALQFAAQDAHQPGGAVAQDRGNVHFDGLVVADDDDAARDLHLSLREVVQLLCLPVHILFGR